MRLPLYISLLFSSLLSLGTDHANLSRRNLKSDTSFGVEFRCEASKLQRLKTEMEDYFRDLKLPLNQIQFNLELSIPVLNIHLKTPMGDTNTLDLINRRELQIPRSEPVIAHVKGKKIALDIASKQEIIAALLQRGRLTPFHNEHCSLESFKDHVGVRQNTVFWAMAPRRWNFATGNSTRVNSKYWEHGWILKPGIALPEAFLDAFTGDTHKYALACTRECEVIMAQGFIDYYSRIKQEPLRAAYIQKISENTPLDRLEVTVSDSKEDQITQEGTLLDRQFWVPGDNWVPGDWAWWMNPDDRSADIPGQEGSNRIYLGGGYLAKLPSGGKECTTKQKTLEVWGWGHRIHNLRGPERDNLYHKLKNDPRNGGILRDVRDIPKHLPPEASFR